jgi:hypothetical protein
MGRVSPNMEDFSDDPAMFNAVYDLEEGKKEDINQTIINRTKRLADQFAALKLQNGKTEEMVTLLRQMTTRK